VIYEFRKGFVPPANPCTATEAMQELKRVTERRRILNPRTLADDVEEAHEKKEDHVLAWAFTWDTARAVRKLHEIEAGDLLRAVVVREVVPEQHDAVRALVLIRDESGHDYRPIQVALRVKDQREQVLEQAREELEQFNAKMRELLALCAMIGS
jgi:hypothetical protein